MDRKQHPNLSEGAITMMIKNDLGSDNPVLQVLGLDLHGKYATGVDRYRILLSDGKYSYAYGALPERLNDLITEKKLENFAIIQVLETRRYGEEPTRVIMLVNLKILVAGNEVGEKIGDPQTLNDNALPGGSKRPRVQTVQVTKYAKKPRSNVTGITQYFKMSRAVLAYTIASLQPYTTSWPVKVWVASKSVIVEYRNERGSGTWFSMILVDHNKGEIRALAFNEKVDEFYSRFELYKWYYIRGACVKEAEKQYSYVKNNYRMNLTEYTHLANCPDQSVPSVTFNFVPIKELTKLNINSYIDVIGVAKSASEVSSVFAATTNNELNKRDVHLIDSSSTEVILTLWGKQAEDFDASSHPVVALKGAKLKDFYIRSLSAVFDAVLQINPDISEARNLRAWFDTIGCTAPSINISL